MVKYIETTKKLSWKGLNVMNKKRINTSIALFCFVFCSLLSVIMCGCGGNENITGYISFPGLGIDWFGVNRVAFTIPVFGGFPVMWYGVIITAGMVLAYLCGLSRAKIEGVKLNDMADLALAVIIAGIVGARLYYVIFYEGGSYFKGNIGEVLKNIINIRSGGLAIYGGIIGGVAASFAVAKIKKIKYLVILDILAPCVLIGQVIGRWGNFVNMEAYGGETEAFIRMGLRSVSGLSEFYVHPTFLYESLWNLAGLLFILWYYKRKRYDGQILFMYMIWYGFGRGMIEGLRSDSLMLGNIRISQLVGFVSCAAGILLMLYFELIRTKQNQADINKISLRINSAEDKRTNKTDVKSGEKATDSLNKNTEIKKMQVKDSKAKKSTDADSKGNNIK